MDNMNVGQVDEGTDDIVVADESLGLELEPSDEPDESTLQEEDTSNKNEEKATDSQKDPDGELKGEAGGDAKHSGKLLNELGESRKVLAQDLIALAQESGTAREMVKKRIEESPALEKLFKSKFGEQYDALMKGGQLDIPDKKQITDAELATIEERARIKAKAELLESAAQEKLESDLESYAMSQNFDSDELIELRKAVDILKGSYEMEDAIQKAALIVNQSKVNAVRSGVVPSGGGANVRPEQSDDFLKDLPEDTLKQYANVTGQKPEEVIQNLKDIKERTSEGGTVYHFE